ncbi:MAG: sigma-54-dependent Fis family transcriptional regulator [bacterium]|nr:sigma-54-dependent Fis family transcriptional regulator [bacterium]
MLDIKGNPLADYINEICKSSGFDPLGDIFDGCDLVEDGFSIKYNELLAFSIVQNWDPAYNPNAKAILKSRKKFNEFLKKFDFMEGAPPKDILSEYLRLAGKFYKYGLIITNFLEAHRIYSTIERISNSDLPVCVFGETGTGKELVGSIIHKLNNSKNKITTLNCAGLPDHILHRELFGYARGAFPGATEDHEGYLASADGGTLFLDEIGDAGKLFQKAMLRFLDDGTYNCLGDPLIRKAKCRIICTTKSTIQDFQKATPDFYHRISGHTIYLPPLRHMRSNIPLLLLLHTLAISKRYNYSDTVVFPGILLKFWIAGAEWEGNYRQLKNHVEDYATKFIHQERDGGYKIDRPFYNLIPIDGKFFEKDPLYILKQCKKDDTSYSRLYNLVDTQAITPYLEKLSPKENIWYNTIIDLLHMIANPYLHYALLRLNKQTGGCEYDFNSYNRYTNFRIISGHEDLDKTKDQIKKSPTKTKIKGKQPPKKPKFSLETYNCIEATIDENNIAFNIIRLTPGLKSKDKIIEINFLNSSTREFMFLLFLIYEGECGEEYWLENLISAIKKQGSIYQKLKEVFKWCDFHSADIEELGDDTWWNNRRKRRELKRQISAKGHKVGIKEDLIVRTEKHGRGGSYQLNPFITTAKITKSQST